MLVAEEKNTSPSHWTRTSTSTGTSSNIRTRTSTSTALQKEIVIALALYHWLTPAIAPARKLELAKLALIQALDELAQVRWRS